MVPEYLEKGTDKQGEGQRADPVGPSERSTDHQDSDLEGSTGGPDAEAGVDKCRHQAVSYTSS